LVGYSMLGILCIALTGSRGAFVCLLVWLMLAVWQSRWRSKLIMLLLPTAPLLFLALPPQLPNRFETIVNPAVGPKNARESADGRIQGFWIGMELWQKNPLAGVGPGAWREATGRKLLAHNLYGQLAGEMGTVGVLTFGGVVLAYGWNLRKIRRAYRERPEWDRDFLFYLTNSIGVAVLLLLLGGMVGHNLLRIHWVLYAAFLVAARHCVNQRISATSGMFFGEEETENSWQADGETGPIGHL